MTIRPILIHFALLLCLLAAPRTSAADDLATDYFQRLSATDWDSLDSVLALADWARRSGLDLKAADLYRRALQLDPDHDAAYEHLVKITDNTRLPEDEQRQKEFAAQFGEGFDLHVGSHFLIVYNTDRTWATNRALLLERAHDIFYLAFRRGKMKPMPLAERLECVLFEQFDDYDAYAKETDGVDIGWSGGYYSPRTNRIAFFNDRSSPAFKETVDRITQLEAATEDLDRLIVDAGRNRQFALVEQYRRDRAAAQKELGFLRNRHGLLASMADSAKTTHEAVHQLAFNSGLQTRGVMYPFWLSEGLGTNFEVDDPKQPFGPFADNFTRRKHLREAVADKKLTPLAEFITIVVPPTTDQDELRVIYAQAWGLFRFCFRKKHDELRKYFERLATGPKGMRDAEALTAEFVDAFGPLDRVEREWTTWLRTVR